MITGLNQARHIRLTHIYGVVLFLFGLSSRQGVIQKRNVHKLLDKSLKEFKVFL